MNILPFLQNIQSKELIVILTAAMPIVELRGAIPVGIAMGINPWFAYLLGVLGSMIPVPFILWLIRPIFHWIKQFRFFKHFVERLTHKTLKKSGNINKYGFWGLMVFVAIPLPGTGVWTGALAASLLEMEFKKAFFAVFLGNVIAGFIMMNFSQIFFR